MEERRPVFSGEKWITSLNLILSAILFVGGAQAQGPSSPEKIHELGLPTLSGEVTVYYSEGYAKRATYLQGIVQAANRFLKKPEITGVELDLGLAILDPKDWAKVTRLPYGISHIQLGESPAAIVPASADNVLVNGMLESEERVSEDILRRLDQLGITYEDAVPIFFDLIAIHEIGHIYTHAYGTWPTEKWLSEFIATYLAHAFLEDSRPKLAQLWETLMNSMIETNEHEHTTLADFEDLYIKVGNSNYGWYQAKFHQRVGEVFAKSGISFMHALKQSLAENPEAAEDDPFRLRELDTLSEGFVAWAVGPAGDLN